MRMALLFPAVVYVSPLRRCIQTADILFPDVKKRVVPGLREMDFGLFENRTASELLADPATRALYQAFVDSNATLPCPPSEQSLGESIQDFLARTADAFRMILREQTTRGNANDAASKVITIIAHGGTQMSLFSQFCPWQITDCTDGNNPYYAWQTDCGGWRWGSVTDAQGDDSRNARNMLH